MTKPRLFAAAALTFALSGAMTAAPVLTSEAVAKPAKAKAKSKAAAAEPAAPADAAAPAAETATPAGPAAPPEQQIATSNPAANIPAVLQASGQFTILLKAVTATNLTSVLSSPARPLTVFAPTDAAFNALPPGVLAALMEPANAATLQKILTYHVVGAKLPGSSIKGHAKSPVPTAANVNLTVDGASGPVKINDATLLQSDVAASNGVIHVIDKVLVPAGTVLPTPATGATPAGAMGAAPAGAMGAAPSASSTGAAPASGVAPAAPMAPSASPAARSPTASPTAPMGGPTSPASSAAPGAATTGTATPPQ